MKRMFDVKRMLVVGALVGALVVAVFGSIVRTAHAAPNPAGTGQPLQTCLSSTAPNEPGKAASAPGSAFNENGGKAGSVYAGNQTQNSKNPKSVAQYDVACFQVSHH